MSGVENTEWYKQAEKHAKADPNGVYDGCMTWLLDEKIKNRRRNKK
jgi:hypothetical protein